MYDTGESLVSYTFWAGQSTLDRLLSYNTLCHGSEDCQRHKEVGISKQASLRNKRNTCQQTATHFKPLVLSIPSVCFRCQRKLPKMTYLH